MKVVSFGLVSNMEDSQNPGVPVDSIKPKPYEYKRHDSLLDVDLKQSPTDFVSANHFFTTTSFHGVYLAYKSRSVVGRTFWSGILIFGLCFLVYQVATLLVLYLEYPTLTSLNVVYPQEGIQMPNFTVCILNRINQTKMDELYPELDPEVSEFMAASFTSAYSTAIYNIEYFERGNNTRLDLFQEKADRFLSSRNHSLLEFFEIISHQCDELFKGCWFENGMIFDCCSIAHRFLSHNGPCFTFVNAGQFVQSIPGPVGGIGFIYWHPTNHLSSAMFNAYEEDAIHIFTEPIDASLGTNPVALTTGIHAHISLEATITERVMKSDKTNCDDPIHLKYFQNYSYAVCQMECMIDEFIFNCNCTGLNTFVEVDSGTFCSPKAGMECFKRHAYNLTQMLKECRTQKCPENCSFRQYRATASTGRVFQKNMLKKATGYIQGVPEGLDVYEHLILAELYFSDLRYTAIKEVYAVTIETFVSNIGGSLGLWTGASVISIIHLLYYAVVAAFSRKKYPLVRLEQVEFKPQQHRNMFLATKYEIGKTKLAEANGAEIV